MENKENNNCLINVNLDAMDLDELREFQNGLIILQSYLIHKIAAIRNRRNGKIDRAIYYENKTDEIYGELPECVKSW
ncbi:MAG: hypothetical protein Q7R95_11345 [bacterium]|nr:hypothetical protein [bacterium]